MNENQNNIQNYEDEIDLRELIMALWKKKKMIVALTLICAILVGLVSMFVMSPVYDTKLNIVISMPEVYHTGYGEYTLPITSNDQYINLITSNNVLINTITDMDYKDVSVEDLRKRIDIDKGTATTNTNQNSFTINVSADNPEESLKLAQTLFDNYMEFMDVMTKERVVDYYLGYFDVELRAKQNFLDIENDKVKKNEELLLNTPKTIDGIKSNVEIETQLNENSDYVVPIDIVNPNYIKVESEITQSKQEINETLSTMQKYEDYLEELNAEKQAIASYYETGREVKLASNIASVVDNSVYLPSPPVAPTQKTSPSNAMNTVIGAVVGLMIGVIAALVKEYWVKDGSVK